MIDNDFLQQLSARAAALFPAADSARQKLETELHGLLQSSLARMNVVTREEFAAQTRVLEQARVQIAALEAKVTALESANDAKVTVLESAIEAKVTALESANEPTADPGRPL